MGFEFKDRRGENKAVPVTQEVHERLEAAVATGDVEEINRVSAEAGGGPAHKIAVMKTVRGEVQGWRGPISFLAVMMPMGQAQLFLCRAVGMRTDEKLYTADYAIPPVWGAKEDFAAEATKRLNTFLSCACDDEGRCKFHGEALPGPKGPGKWLEDDVKRLQNVEASPLPEAVEVLMRQEAAKAQGRIVVPGR